MKTAFAQVKLQTGAIVSRVNGPTDHAWMGFSSYKKNHSFGGLTSEH